MPLLLKIVFLPPGSSLLRAWDLLLSRVAPAPLSISTSVQGVAGQVVTRTVLLDGALDGVRFCSFRLKPYFREIRS